jgi:asparagine synthetase B (glutamine-hydrolysing)
VMEHLPHGAVPLLRRLRRGRSTPWYSPEFLRLARRRISCRPSRGGPFPSSYIGSLYGSARAGYYVFCMEWDNKLASAFGLEMAFPFLDRDLIQFMIGVPGEYHARLGVPKRLLREAMRGIVPAAILDRTWKADFTHLVNNGMDREFIDLLDCLESSGRAAELGYLNRSRLRETLVPLREQLLRPDCVATWQLSDVLALELWLQAFFSAPAPPGSAAKPAGVC